MKDNFFKKNGVLEVCVSIPIYSEFSTRKERADYGRNVFQ